MVTQELWGMWALLDCFGDIEQFFAKEEDSTEAFYTRQFEDDMYYQGAFGGNDEQDCT